MRIGTFIGRFFVSTTTTILEGGSLLWTGLCILVAFYLMFWHGSNVMMVFLAGYILLLGVFPAMVLGLTALITFVLAVIYINIHYF